MVSSRSWRPATLCGLLCLAGTLPAARADQVIAPVAGFIPGEGFILKSADDNYRLQLRLQAGFRYEPTIINGDGEGANYLFVIRPILAGNIFRPWLRFLVSAELAATPPFLLDAWAEAQPVSIFGLRFGQQVTPVSRHESYGPGQILFPDFDIVANYFWTGRDRGITLYGTTRQDTFEYYVGAYTGSPLSTPESTEDDIVVEARVTISPLGVTGVTEFPYVSVTDGPAPFRYSFTLQGIYGNKTETSEAVVNPSAFQFAVEATPITTSYVLGSADLFIQSSRFVLFGEGYVRRSWTENGTPNFTSVGAWVQAGYLIYKKYVDAAIRLSWADPSLALAQTRLLVAEAQVAYYIKAPMVVLKLRYAWANQESPGAAALGSVQLPLSIIGTYNLITIQLNVMF